ncbi:MAG: GxxExxY protein [Gemmatimonadaceae bacterium]
MLSVPVLSIDAERAIRLTDERKAGVRLLHDELTGRLLAAFFAVHRELGYGFDDGVYFRALLLELGQRMVHSEQSVPLGVFYKGRKVGVFRASLIVEGAVVVALSTGPQVPAAAAMQLANVMRCACADVGMLLHFGPQPEFRRLFGRRSGEPEQIDDSRTPREHMPSS